jgi:hypothetical protein
LQKLELYLNALLIASPTPDKDNLSVRELLGLGS